MISTETQEETASAPLEFRRLLCNSKDLREPDLGCDRLGPSRAPFQHLVRRAAGGGESGAAGFTLQHGSAGSQSPCTAFSTASAWPATLTLCQSARTTPESSITKVERSMPMYWRP